MQSRRNEEFLAVSPNAKSRTRVYDSGPEMYLASGRDLPKWSPRSRRSPSPLNGGRRDFLVGDRRSGSLEREDHCWHMRGGMADEYRPRSPHFEEMKKRSHFDEEIPHKKYKYSRSTNHGTEENIRLKNVFNYHNYASNFSKAYPSGENIIERINRHEMLPQKGENGSIQGLHFEREVESVRGLHRLPVDMGPPSNYGETGRPLSSSRMDINQFENGKPRNWDPIPTYERGREETYAGRDNNLYNMVSTSHSKDFASTCKCKDLGRSSAEAERGDFLSSYQDSKFVHQSNEFSRFSGKIMEPVNVDPYGQRSHVDYARDHEIGQRNLTTHQCSSYHFIEDQRKNYFYPKPRGIQYDDCRYQDDIHGMVSSRAEVDYDNARMDYDNRGLSRPRTTHPTAERIGYAAHFGENQRKRDTWDHPSFKREILDNLDMNSTSNAVKQGTEYLDSERAPITRGNRLSRDCKMLQKGVSNDNKIFHLRSDQDTDPGIQRERSFRTSPISGYDSKMQRVSVRAQTIKGDERGMYDQADKVLKRKCIVEEDIGGHNSRNTMSNKWNTFIGFQDVYNSEEEWIDDDTNGFYSSMNVKFDHTDNREADTYDEKVHHGDLVSDDLLEAKYPLKHVQRHSLKYYRSGSRYIKGHQRPGSLKCYSSPKFPRSGFIHKHHRVLKRNNDYHEELQANDGEPTENLENYSRSEPADDSEEFKQLVHRAFLKYSKRLNMNLSVRKRYKEQGKAGSLFCIVCGRSLSKEFMNTQRLVMHAFMSRKVGLRVEHLGLHKAICVLLGWSSVATPDTITWAPQALPDAEALAQKEDLIFWPPLIIIHNISLSNNHHLKEQKIVSLDALEAFLRGKGLVNGRVKIRLGRPADQSVMLVKFLGNFSGLEQAERIHEYFSDKNRGRVDFEQMVSRNWKTGKSMGSGMEGDEMDELLLYGYMGIADDLEKVDISTKTVGLIESKKEIQDIADAPVKADER